MTQSPIKQFLILFGGMLLLAIPLSVITWLKEDKKVPPPMVKVTEASDSVGCYLEIFCTENLKNVRFLMGDELLGTVATLQAHEWGEVEFELEERSISNHSFSIKAERVKDDSSSTQAAMRIIFTPEGQDAFEQTFWFAGDLTRNFNLSE